MLYIYDVYKYTATHFVKVYILIINFHFSLYQISYNVNGVADTGFKVDDEIAGLLSYQVSNDTMYKHALIY